MILTISQEYASGAPEIGEQLARKLGIRLYEKEGLKEEAEKSGLYEDMKMFLTEEYYDSLLYAIAENYSCTQIGEIPFSQMRKIAGRQPCIILGMGANCILRERKDLVSIFLHSDKEKRIQKVMEMCGLKASKAKKLIDQEDKRKEKFYQYYMKGNWKSADEYHLTLDTGRLGIEQTVDFILYYIQSMQSHI
ncbi:cytidylate kinase-like family protein [Ruminococcus sp. OA3]|uniref:cytidylate kinase-like family protein n=1 Tax=Ruminococcus sp. OA3 TaxID=2914164 RepID=UPI001F051DA1|nr:cytidylate kinase-like family protein [Ruminococcus sp. OA3]MCH1981753.1 cytidylate kinase-like family protein [Ruminococcus sp. OA3]